MDRRIGAQLYTVREHMQTIEGFDETCKKIKEIGYQLVQISGTPLKANEMRCVLEQYGLQVVTSHRGFDFWRIWMKLLITIEPLAVPFAASAPCLGESEGIWKKSINS